MHHAQGVPVRPLLNDLGVFDAMDSDSCEGYLIARGSDAHQFALVGTLTYPSGNNLVPFSHIVLDSYAQVGDGGTYHGDELRQTLDAYDIFVGFVQDEVMRVHLCKRILEGVQTPPGNDLPGTAS